MTKVSTPLYSRTMRFRDFLFVSGQLPVADGTILHPGRVGDEVRIDDAREAAALAARRCLEAITEELGSTDAITGVARIGGYVAVADGDVNVPFIIDAASQHVLDALGDRGRHSRVALGVASLPANACVEIEMVVQC